MRCWSSCVIKSLTPLVDEWIPWFHKREQFCAGKAGELLHVVYDIGAIHHYLQLKVEERCVECRQVSVPTPAARDVGCHAVRYHASHDAVLLSTR